MVEEREEGVWEARNINTKDLLSFQTTRETSALLGYLENVISYFRVMFVS